MNDNEIKEMQRGILILMVILGTLLLIGELLIISLLI